MKIQIPESVLENVTLLNMGLLALAAAGIACTVVALADISVSVSPASLADPSAGGPAAVEKQTPAYADYALIADQNLFHPTRKYVASGGPAMPRPEVILYGTLITESVQVAYLEDKKSPRTTPGRGKRQLALKKGESLSGYVLTVVEKDRIELAKGGDKIVVHLSNQNKERSEETTRSASALGSHGTAVQPRAAPTGSPPAVQPRSRTAAPQPAVQPRPPTSGPQSAAQPAAPGRITPARSQPATAPR